MEKIKVGIIGSGYIGPAHVEAVRRLGFVEVIALAEANQELAEKKACSLHIPKAYGDYRRLLDDKTIQAVHNCTPNYLHLQVNRDILQAGKHCISEKPLGIHPNQSLEQVKLAKKMGLVCAVNFNYRYYPLIQHIRQMVFSGQLGRVFAVQGCYMQDWLLYETDWSWRLDPSVAGPSRTIADVGSHWFDLIQFLTGKKIVRVLADLWTLHPYRKRPKQDCETFAGKILQPQDYDRVKIDSEDGGHILIQLEDGAKGLASITQVACGRKNHIVVELYGTEKSVWWDHERPNELHIGNRNKPNEWLLKDPSLIDASIRDYAHYPAGHNEGYPSALMNFCRNVYRYIAGFSKAIDFATFEEGYDVDCIVAAAMESHRQQGWQTVIREKIL